MAIRNVPASAQLKLCAPACVVSKYCIAAIFTVVVIPVELNIGCVFPCRSEWGSVDEPCHKKLPFELWALMKAEGSAQSPDALHVRENCIQSTGVGLLELITPKVRQSRC